MHQREEEISDKTALPRTQNGLKRYSSVEISHHDISFCYHFRLWTMPSMDMCILVKEDSKILPQLKEGFTYTMKYYGCNPFDPVEKIKTAVRHITKDSQGRYKGHYLVHLELLNH